MQTAMSLTYYRKTEQRWVDIYINIYWIYNVSFYLNLVQTMINIKTRKTEKWVEYAYWNNIYVTELNSENIKYKDGLIFMKISIGIAYARCNCLVCCDLNWPKDNQGRPRKWLIMHTDMLLKFENIMQWWLDAI